MEPKLLHSVLLDPQEGTLNSGTHYSSGKVALVIGYIGSKYNGLQIHYDEDPWRRDSFELIV